MTASGLSGNPRRFVLFGVFYNARAYYPVLAVLFIDLGLTLDQFVLLNLVWAASIFLFEVPSGALADTIGRKKLLVASSALMIAEMLCLLLAPRDGGAALFSLCVLNRVLSGLSEACASGADEALAYDSLPEENRAELWDRTLGAAMKWRSAGYVIAMVLGGLIYEPDALNRMLPAGMELTSAVTHRLPVLLVLCQGIACLFITLRMVEPPRETQATGGNALREALRLTWKTARWVFTHPHTRVVVILGLFIDSIARNLATINSTYYRMIGLHEWTFGFIGAATGVIGWFVPQLAKRSNEKFGTLPNLGIAAGATLVGLAGVAQVWPVYGVIPSMLLLTMLGFLSFTISRSLHREADSSQRATVLSVKGLAFNLGYGLFSLGFSRLLASLPDQPEGAALRQALVWQVPAFAIAGAVLFAWAAVRWRRGK